eukprot:CAMPEP_0116100670 /NCGR_PEP_ID=MMETSP0327-20121206/12407_1 /TAXON_ID=44447 /ORGANISM="Pseudo-nitzschia delicatissima, Strain B596" /LENGTH=159 /DNA_ID=CAMNT_0003592593 /DNA_START=134 /DNA_END=613 /DNA_ORIENTATION=-
MIAKSNYRNLPQHSIEYGAMRIKTNDQIRHRLIRNLGIDHSSKTNFHGSQHQKNILKAKSEEVPLKNHGSQKVPEKTDSRIQFNSVVQSMPIPSHQDYSDRVKRLLWSNGNEIRENAQRNAREFAFEGWSAQCVLEEDQMYLDVGSMEFIHPVHVVGFS